MYLGDTSVCRLGAFLRGYRFALWEDAGRPCSVQAIDEDELPWFQEFVSRRYHGEPVAMGWERILMEQSVDASEGMELFWSNWDAFIESVQADELPPR